MKHDKKPFRKILVSLLLITTLMISNLSPIIILGINKVNADAPEINWGYPNYLYKTSWTRYDDVGGIWWVPSSRYASHYVCVRNGTSPLLIEDSTVLTYRNGYKRPTEEDYLSTSQFKEGQIFRLYNAQQPGYYDDYPRDESPDNGYAVNSNALMLSPDNKTYKSMWTNNLLKTLHSAAYDHYFISKDKNKPNAFYSPWDGIGTNWKGSTAYQSFYERPIYTPFYTGPDNTAFTVQDVVVKLNPSTYNINVDKMSVNAAGVESTNSYAEPNKWVISQSGSGGEIHNTVYKDMNSVNTILHPFYRWRTMIIEGNGNPTSYIQMPVFTRDNTKANALSFEKSKNSQIISDKGRYFPYSFEDGPIKDVLDTSYTNRDRVASITLNQITSWEKRYGIPRYINDRGPYSADIVPWKLDNITNCNKGEVYRSYYTNWAFAIGSNLDLGGSYDGPTTEDVQDETQLDVGDIKDTITNDNSSVTDNLTNSDITNSGNSTDKLYEEDTNSSLTVLFSNVPSNGIVTANGDNFRPQLTISLKDNMYMLPFSINSNNGNNDNESAMWSNYKNKGKLTTDLFIYRISDPSDIPSSFTQFQSKPSSEFAMPITTISSDIDKTKLNNFKISEPGYYVLGANTKSALTGETNFQTKTIKVMFPNGFNGLPVENYLDTTVNDNTVENSFNSKKHNMDFKYETTNSIKVESSYNSSTGVTAIGSGNGGTTLIDKEFNEIDLSSGVLNGSKIVEIKNYKSGFLVLTKDDGMHYVDTKKGTVQPINGLSSNSASSLYLEGDNVYVALQGQLVVGSLTESDSGMDFKRRLSITNNKIFGKDAKIGTIDIIGDKIAVTSKDADGNEMVVLINRN